MANAVVGLYQSNAEATAQLLIIMCRLFPLSKDAVILLVIYFKTIPALK
jgi:hypothetical protein